MRLVIAFDLDFEIKNDDIVIALEKPVAVEEGNFIKVDNQKLIDVVDELEALKHRLVKKHKSEVIKNTITSSINNFNRNWMLPLFKWLDTVDEVLRRYDVSEIVISGHTKSVSFVPYYEAEGEVGSKLLYKSFDVLPSLVADYLKQKHYKLTIVNKKSSLKLLVRVFTRRYVLLTYKVFIFLVKKVKTKTQNNSSVNFNEIKFLFSTRSIAHTEYMYKFLKSFNKETLIHVSDGFHGGSKNLDFIKSGGFTNYVSLYKSISVFEIIAIFFKILKGVFSVKRNLYFEIRGVKLNMSSAIREMIISYFDALTYKQSISNTVKNNNLKLVTGEMYTPYAYTLAELGRETNNLSYQLQTTAMMIRKEPDFFYCDEFLMNSKQNAEDFKKIYTFKTDKIKYNGSLLIDEKKLNKTSEYKDLKKVIYFTQPLVEEEQEFMIIDELLKLEKEKDFSLYIKLHPRERDNKLDRYKSLKLNVIDNRHIFKDYIKDFDLAVIRNTSLGSSLIVEGIPIITCLLTENAKNSKLDYIDHDFYGTIYKIHNLENMVVNYQNLCTAFKTFRENYIIKNQLDKGIEYFYNNL